jgi:hypothetical protein
MSLGLPKATRIEDVADPKQLLFTALQTASGKTGRHLKKLRVAALRYNVADRIEDISPLRNLSAFRSLEEELVATLGALPGIS